MPTKPSQQIRETRMKSLVRDKNKQYETRKLRNDDMKKSIFQNWGAKKQENTLCWSKTERKKKDKKRKKYVDQRRKRRKYIDRKQENENKKKKYDDQRRKRRCLGQSQEDKERILIKDKKVSSLSTSFSFFLPYFFLFLPSFIHLFIHFFLQTSIPLHFHLLAASVLSPAIHIHFLPSNVSLLLFFLSW